MLFRTLYAVILTLAVTPALCNAQATDPKSVVTAADEKKVKDTAQRFIARFKQTHDVGELLDEFFVASIYDAYGGEVDFFFRKYTGAKLTQDEWKTAFSIEQNCIYLLSLNIAMDGDEDFSGILEKSLGKKIQSGCGNGVGNPIADRSQFLAVFDGWNKDFPQARSVLNSKDFEDSSRYLASLARMSKNPALNYSIAVRTFGSFGDEDSNDPTETALGKRFSRSAPIYFVSVPQFFSILFVKESDEFKILTLGPIPD